MGAKKYIEENYGTMDCYSDLIIAVGNNDIDSQSSVENVLIEMGALVNLVESLLGDVKIHILQALPRPQNNVYNKKMRRYNGGLYSLESDIVNIITNNEIGERDSENFTTDNIHLSHSGNIALVHVLKDYMNPVLGLPPYESYKTNKTDSNSSSNDEKGFSKPGYRGQGRPGRQRGQGYYNNNSKTRGRSFKDQMLELLNKM